MKRIIGAALIAAVATFAMAQEKNAPAAEKKPEVQQEKPKQEYKDQISTSSGSVRVGSETINYTAKAGTIILRDEKGDPRASFFVVSYTKDGVDPARRPVTYTFNGGPGSSSVWLHMGAFGPRRVAYGDDEGHAAAPPYTTVNNDQSILDVTDLVFIDPVSTGYSRAIPFEDAKKFHGVDADAEAVGELIRLWTTRNARWASPKFLAGESYGTTRAAALSGWLHDQGFYLNGIVLISSVLNFQTLEFDSGNDLEYALILPTYTATAWYHKKLPADLQQGTVERAVAESEQFALGEYTAALMKGDRITPDERASAIQKLSRLTGLSPQYVQRANLRLDLSHFSSELLRDQNRTSGRLDTRFTGMVFDANAATPAYDPAYAAIYGEYTAAFNDYVRRNLKFESDLPYEILTGKAWPWKFEKAENRYLDVAQTLHEAMVQNPFLKVFVANGYYDAATPFGATNYTFARMQLDPAIRDHVTLHYYRGGHMMYIDRAAHRQLHDDVSTFIRSAVPVAQ